jgi:hypothetical protein
MKHNAQWILLNPVHLESAWPKCAPWLIQAIGAADEWDQIDEIRQDVAKGRMQLWVVQNEQNAEVLATFVTEIQLVGRAKTLVVRWMGGKEIDKWLDDLGVIERWGQRNDLTSVEIWGRPGWSKRFAPHGYREDFRVISKRIDKELH